MPPIIGNKKIRIVFYILLLIFLSTITFFEKTKIFGNSNFFQVEIVEINGHKKINQAKMKKQLNFLMGKNLFFIKSEDIKDIISANELISSFEIKKKYPNTISIEIKEVNFVAKLVKEKKKYFLADNNALVPFKKYPIDQDLPNIYGKNADRHFNDFQKLLKSNNFDLNMIERYYFFQINRWDLILNNKKTIKFPPKGVEEAINIVNKLLKDKDFDRYSIIDLRINNKIITE